MAGMTIGELARARGVGVETIRYYQRRGLLAVPDVAVGPGSRGPVRRYGDGDVERLRFVRSAKAAGFSLDEIAELLRLDDKQDRAAVRALAGHRIAQLDIKLRELGAARVWLAKLEKDCATTAAGPCPILSAFRTARTESCCQQARVAVHQQHRGRIRMGKRCGWP